MQHKSLAAFITAAAGLACGAHGQALTGPSTTQTPYMLPSQPGSGVVFVSIISNGNGTNTPNETYPRLGGGSPYRLVGIPDGLGTFRTAQNVIDGTFTVTMNHELPATDGIVRAHGSRGATVSIWEIRRNPGQADNLEVMGGRDLIQTVKLWDVNTSAYTTWNAANPMLGYANNVYGGANPNNDGFARFCSADVAAVSAYQFGSLGTAERIHMNGEENGFPGRTLAHIATGPEAGTSYELPRLGDASWENSVACPFPQEKTIVVTLDDTTPGNLYIYVGTKQATGTTIERAGLTNGRVWGIKIDGTTVNGSGQNVEDRTFILGNATSGPVSSKPFTTIDLGDLTNVTGAQLQSSADAMGQMNFLRPEDGAWDTVRNNRLYFVTTDAFSPGNSRLWAMDFTDITHPEQGGTVTMLVDGSVPSTLAGGYESASGLTDIRMMDNICVTQSGMVLICEDVGNNPRLGRLWLYDPAADKATEIGVSDPDRFLLGGSHFLTQDEETSGVISAESIIGPGWFLLDMQAHYAISGELVEGGQLMAVYIPQTVPGSPCYANCDGSTTQPILNVNDFLCFQSRFAAGDSYANCDGSTTEPVLNVNDFLCFQSHFAGGCR